jgi:hypothetical protein
MKNHISLAFLLLLLSCSPNPGSRTALPPAEEATVDYSGLQAELEDMRFKDQEIRRILVDSIGLRSPQAGPYFAKMQQIDSVNQVRIKEILQEHGWIPQSKIGKTASDAIFYVVQHSNVELMEQYYPQLHALALQGEASRKHAAMMEDRLLMWQGKKQKWGTQASGNLREDNRMAIWPIETPDSVNIRRKQIGFELTVEEYAASFGAEYDKDEALPQND